MEVGLIIGSMVLQVFIYALLLKDMLHEHRKTQNRLYQAELLANGLAIAVEKLTKSLDKTENIVLSLSKREDALKTQEHLLEMREGGWRGV